MAKKKSTPFTYRPDMRILLLKGADGFLQAQYLRMVVEGLESELGAPPSRFDFDGAATTLADLLDELRSYGLMQDHKVVVLDAAEQFVRKESNRRGLESYAAAPMPDATLVMRTTGDWRAPKLEKAVDGVGAVVPCESPDARTAAAWAVGRAEKAHGASLERSAATRLVDRVGSDLAKLDAEIAKLAVAADGDPPTIRDGLIDEMVPPSREEQGWMIQSVVLGGDSGRALRTLRSLKDVSRVPDQVIAWALVDLGRKLHEAARQIESGVPEGAVGKSLRLWGPDTRPVLETARRLGGDRAGRLFDLAIRTDEGLKSGRSGDGPRTLEGLTVLLADSCR